MKLNIQLFASGTVDNFTKVKGTTSATLQGKIEWSSVGDATTNKSIVTTKLYARRTDNYTSTPTSGKNWGGKVKVGDNTAHSFSTLSKNTSVASSWVLFATYTDEIEHDIDGTKTITISGSVTGATGTSLEGKTSSGSKTFELDQLHKLPDEVTFDILEVNEELINAGVSNDTFVKELSIKSFNISGNTYDNATIKEYGILNRIMPYGTATLPLIIDFSQNEILTDLTYVTKVPITGRIIDSYDTAGYSETLLFDYVPYNKIKLVETSTTVKRNGQTSGKVRLNINGNLYNGIVGNADQSTYKPIVKYKFWQTGTEEPTTYDYEIPSDNITIENGVFNVSNYEIGSSVETDINWFNPENAYKIKVYVKDNFTSYESQEKSIAVGEATWTEYKDRCDFKRITVKGNDIYTPVIGDVITTSTNVGTEEMAKRYGGTWELYDKQFKDVYEFKTGTAIATLTSLSSLEVRITRTGHMVHLDCNAKTSANLTDTTVSVCTLKSAVLGFNGSLADRMMYFAGYSDGGNNMIQFGMVAKSLLLESYDVVGDGSHKVSSGANIMWSQTIVADNFTQLADAYCDKFYWKRIS